ncbi:phosphoribosylaminoimidazole-succinocarboxamide synthase [Zopfochytrium polystomum]|nr:phosphoribosylaminoimidazole-succinocarboxamide synthase [Zopfochytrium polystomum]
MAALTHSNCPDLKLLARGKVRDLYDIDDRHLLFVATDRISAFDVIMKNGITDKGKLLTQMSVFWFSFLEDIVSNHLVTADINQMPASVQKYRDQLEGRSMLVKKLKIVPCEAIVRGYLSGSGWAEYQKKGTVCDIKLPPGLRESDKLDKAIFTPSTKAEIGDHDENIHPDKLAQQIGSELAKKIEEIALKIYTKASNYARSRGIILADTKFEFGLDESGNVVLADEVLTPDSSRFWPADKYNPGSAQPSYDKQFLRDYLLSVNFDKKTGIELPDDIVQKTVAKYREASAILTKPRGQVSNPNKV